MVLWQRWPVPEASNIDVDETGVLLQRQRAITQENLKEFQNINKAKLPLGKRPHANVPIKNVDDWFINNDERLKETLVDLEHDIIQSQWFRINSDPSEVEFLANLNWWTNFIEDMAQYTRASCIYFVTDDAKIRVDRADSKKFPINSGVPQGSVISPTRFLFFINVLLSSSINTIHSFADDSTLHQSVRFDSQKFSSLGIDTSRTSESGTNVIIKYAYFDYNHKIARMAIMGYWQLKTGLRKIVPFSRCCYNLTGYPVKIVYIKGNRPYSYVEVIGDTYKISGISASVLTTILSFLGIRITKLQAHSSDAFGGLDQNGQLIGIFKLLVEKQVDLILDVLVYTEDRLAAVDFTVPIFHEDIVGIYKPPDINSNYFWSFYMKPFSMSSWILILTMILLLMMLSVMLMRYFLNAGVRDPNQYNILAIWGLLLNQGPNRDHSSVGWRIYYWSVMLLGTLLVTFYSSKIVAENAVLKHREYFNDFYEVANHPLYRPIVWKDAAIHKILKVGAVEFLANANLWSNFIQDMAEYTGASHIYFITDDTKIAPKMNHYLALEVVLVIVLCRYRDVRHHFEATDVARAVKFPEDGTRQVVVARRLGVMDDSPTLNKVSWIMEYSDTAKWFYKKNQEIVFSPSIRLFVFSNLHLKGLNKSVPKVIIKYAYYDFKRKVARTDMMGYWQLKTGLRKVVSFSRCCYNLTGYPIKVVYMKGNKPYSYVEKIGDTYKISGISGSILTTILSVLNIRIQKLEAEPTGEFGGLDQNGKPIGIFKVLADKQADIVLDSLASTDDRRTVADFSIPVFYEQVIGIYKPPDTNSNFWSFYMKPFSMSSWILILTMIMLLIMFSVMLMRYFRNADVSDSNKYDILAICGLLLNQGSSQDHTSVGWRIYYLSVMILGTLLVAFYSSKIVAENAVFKHREFFNDFYEVANHPLYRPIVWKEAAAHRVLKSTTDPEASAIWKRMKGDINHYAATSLEEAFEEIEKSQGVFIDISSYIKYLQKPKPFISYFGQYFRLMDLHEEGIIKHIKDENFISSSKIKENNILKQIELSEMIFPIIFIVTAILFTIILWDSYKLNASGHHRKSTKEYKSCSDCEESVVDSLTCKEKRFVEASATSSVPGEVTQFGDVDEPAAVVEASVTGSVPGEVAQFGDVDEPAVFVEASVTVGAPGEVTQFGDVDEPAAVVEASVTGSVPGEVTHFGDADEPAVVEASVTGSVPVVVETSVTGSVPGEVTHFGDVDEPAVGVEASVTGSVPGEVTHFGDVGELPVVFEASVTGCVLDKLLYMELDMILDTKLNGFDNVAEFKELEFGCHLDVVMQTECLKFTKYTEQESTDVSWIEPFPDLCLKGFKFVQELQSAVEILAKVKLWSNFIEDMAQYTRSSHIYFITDYTTGVVWNTRKVQIGKFRSIWFSFLSSNDSTLITNTIVNGLERSMLVILKCDVGIASSVLKESSKSSTEVMIKYAYSDYKDEIARMDIMGYWNLKTGLRNIVPFSKCCYNLTGYPVKIVYIKFYPNVELIPSYMCGNLKVGQHHYYPSISQQQYLKGKWDGEINNKLHAIKPKLGEWALACRKSRKEEIANIEAEPTGTFGGLDKNRKPTGLFKYLVENQADLILDSISRTEDRKMVADFTVPVVHEYIIGIYKPPAIKSHFLSFYMKPFSMLSWIFISTMILFLMMFTVRRMRALIRPSYMSLLIGENSTDPEIAGLWERMKKDIDHHTITSFEEVSEVLDSGQGVYIGARSYIRYLKSQNPSLVILNTNLGSLTRGIALKKKSPLTRIFNRV
ncbi:Ionotropic receptor 25a [Nymphon striatum]|nr:Ionotropic receptor 25a [Nymphon striatum]